MREYIYYICNIVLIPNVLNQFAIKCPLQEIESKKVRKESTTETGQGILALYVFLNRILLLSSLVFFLFLQLLAMKSIIVTSLTIFHYMQPSFFKQLIYIETFDEATLSTNILLLFLCTNVYLFVNQIFVFIYQFVYLTLMYLFRVRRGDNVEGLL